MQNQSDDGNRHLTCLEFEHNLWSTQLLIPAPTDSKATKSMMMMMTTLILTLTHSPTLPIDPITTKSVMVMLLRLKFLLNLRCYNLSKIEFRSRLQSTLDPTYSTTTTYFSRFLSVKRGELVLPRLTQCFFCEKIDQ